MSIANWVHDAQVEQDLVIGRALVEIFSHRVLADGVAFRGGATLYKLYLTPPARYSEDIDFVQSDLGPTGPIMDALHEVLAPWLSTPRWKQTEGRVTLVYRFEPEDMLPLRLRLKVEINFREHFSVFGIKKIPFSVTSRWFDGACSIAAYELDELLATKLRALYQRKKGWDMFDLATALDDGAADPRRTVTAFIAYMERGGDQVPRTLLERNLAAKMHDPQFRADIGPLIARGNRRDMERAAQEVFARLIALLLGVPWKGET